MGSMIKHRTTPGTVNPTEANIAGDQMMVFVDRILALKSKQDDIGADVREVYAEAHGVGLDKQAIGVLVTEQRNEAKHGKAHVEERDTLVDLYRQAYQDAKAKAAAQAHAREAGKKPNLRVVGKRSDSGADIVTKHTGIATGEAKQSPAETPTAGTSDLPFAGQGDDAADKPEAGQPASGDSLKTADEPAGSPAADNRVGPVGGPDTPVAASALTPDAGGATGVALRPKSIEELRPHCLHLDRCGGYGSVHCGPCQKTAEAKEPRP